MHAYGIIYLMNVYSELRAFWLIFFSVNLSPAKGYHCTSAVTVSVIQIRDKSDLAVDNLHMG